MKYLPLLALLFTSNLYAATPAPQIYEDNGFIKVVNTGFAYAGYNIYLNNNYLDTVTFNGNTFTLNYRMDITGSYTAVGFTAGYQYSTHSNPVSWTIATGGGSGGGVGVGAVCITTTVTVSGVSQGPAQTACY